MSILTLKTKLIQYCYLDSFYGGDCSYPLYMYSFIINIIIGILIWYIYNEKKNHDRHRYINTKVKFLLLSIYDAHIKINKIYFIYIMFPS